MPRHRPKRRDVGMALAKGAVLHALPDSQLLGNTVSRRRCLGDCDCSDRDHIADPTRPKKQPEATRTNPGPNDAAVWITDKPILASQAVATHATKKTTQPKLTRLGISDPTSNPREARMIPHINRTRGVQNGMFNESLAAENCGVIECRCGCGAPAGPLTKLRTRFHCDPAAIKTPPRATAPASALRTGF